MLSIQTTDLTKSFGSLVAVRRLNLEVKTGEIFGLVGPDASGKTTTLRMLCGILPPDKGEARVAGYDIRSEAEALKEKVGYLPQKFGLYGDLTVLENIHFYADLYQVSKKQRGERIERLLRCQPPFQKQSAGLSVMKRSGTICALIHTLKFFGWPPQVSIPFKKGFRIILMTCEERHYPFFNLLSREERCSRIMLIYQGEMLIADTPSTIKSQVKETILELRTGNLQKAMKILEGLEFIGSLVLSGDKIHALVDEPERAKREIQEVLRGEGVEISDLLAVRPSLEDAFISMVREKK
jgi:ABC-2 type transport system ATP-binding protein